MENANKLRITIVISVVMLLLRTGAWQIDNVAAWMLLVGWGMASFVLLVWLVAYGYWVWEQGKEGNQLDEKKWYPFFVGVLAFMSSLLMEIPITVSDNLQE